MTDSAFIEFERAFDQVLAVVHRRLEIEWTSHRRGDLRRLEVDLLEMVREFGALLRVVYRYDLTSALREEVGSYAATLAARGPGEDALELMLGSWIVAIQGIVRPPECNELAAPLQAVRAELPRLFAEVACRGTLPAAPETRTLVERLIVGDRLGARGLLQSEIAAGRAAHDLIPDRILPAMQEIGNRWEAETLDMYAEHLATETVILLLGELTSRAAPEASAPRALVGCVPDDHMQIVPMALTAYLQLRGWQAISFGQGLPADQIARAVQSVNPDAVLLSLSMVSRLSGALDLIERLGVVGWRGRIIVGGRGAKSGQTLLERAGATVAASFGDAHYAGMPENAHA